MYAIAFRVFDRWIISSKLRLNKIGLLLLLYHHTTRRLSLAMKMSVEGTYQQ